MDFRSYICERQTQTKTIMKKIMTITAAVFFFAAIASADDRHVDVNRLPETIKTFLNH